MSRWEGERGVGGADSKRQREGRILASHPLAGSEVRMDEHVQAGVTCSIGVVLHFWYVHADECACSQPLNSMCLHAAHVDAVLLKQLILVLFVASMIRQGRSEERQTGLPMPYQDWMMAGEMGSPACLLLALF